jgi:hypothetical protein
MAKFPRLFLRPALIGVALAFVAAVPAFNATASISPRVSSAAALASAGRIATGPSRTFHVLPHQTCAAGHFLYEDNGSSPNYVDGYSIGANCSLTPTPGSPYATGGNSGLTGFGSNVIATSRANGPCVFHTDSGGTGTPSTGMVESFSVASNGALTLVSSVVVADSSYYALDTKVSADGKTVYEANVSTGLFNGSQINILRVGTGCTLTLVKTATFSSPLYFSIAPIGNTALEAVDTTNSHIDFYKLPSLTLIKSNSSSVTSPDGLDTFLAGKKLYSNNGQATFSPPQNELDTTSNGTLTPFPGSPATDTTSSDSNGAFVRLDIAHKQSIQSDVFSNTLGLFGLKSGSFAYLNSTSEPGSGPTATALLGSELFVSNYLSFSIVGCTVGSGSISGCSTLATLGNGAAIPGGIGIL